MTISEIRKQLEIANELARVRVGFIVVPVLSEEQKQELAALALQNINILESQESK